MRNFVVILPLAAVGLLGCASASPERVEATAPTVTYRFSGEDELTTAHRHAEDFCEDYGKDSRLVAARSNLATFECY